MDTLKSFCEKNGLDINKCMDLVIGESSGMLPQLSAMQGYIAEITDDALTFINDKLGVKKAISFASFTKAEFGIGSGLLWLQCVVDGKSFVFSTTRKNWKGPTAKLLLEKISAHTGPIDMKEYNGYTGWVHKNFISP